MNLQGLIIAKYRKLRPDWTLTSMAKELEINLSRLFRLFNGAEMKISEYQKICEVIEGVEQDSTISSKISSQIAIKIKSELECLSKEQLQKIQEVVDYFKHFNMVESFKN